MPKYQTGHPHVKDEEKDLRALASQQVRLHAAADVAAVIDEPGLDIILDPTGELELCLSTALTKPELRSLADFAALTGEPQRQEVRELCAMWDMDDMLHGMTQVSADETGSRLCTFDHCHCISLLDVQLQHERCSSTTAQVAHK